MPGILVAAGISSRTSTVDRRELLALDRSQSEAVAARTAARPEIHEALVLSTCERTELYAIAASREPGEAALREQLEQLSGPLEPPELKLAAGLPAAEHLMRVAAGLESSVPGEFEILGQLRRAEELARERGASGDVLARLVQDALAAGRRIREVTGIARGKSSLSSVAVDLACRFTGEAGEPARALVIGSGDSGSVVARGLRARGAEVRLAARHRSERASRLATQIGAATVELGQPLLDALAEADVVVSCTAAPHRLVPSETLAEVIQRRAGRELLVIDLAMPRDFDPDARSIGGVELYDLDDLRDLVSATIAQRGTAALAAAAIAADEAERFCRWLSALAAVPTIKELRSHTLQSVLEALRRTDLASGADESVLRAASQTIAAGLLHTPTTRLRAAAEIGDADGLTRTVRNLFALESSADALR
jgi:glutamyl-tRNA reductase